MRDLPLLQHVTIIHNNSSAIRTSVVLAITWIVVNAIAPCSSLTFTCNRISTQSLGHGGSTTATVNNPNENIIYISHPVRLQVDVSGCGSAAVTVLNMTVATHFNPAVPVLFQVEVLKGTAKNISKGQVWILESIWPGQVHTYSVSCTKTTQRGTHKAPSAAVKQEGSTYVLSNPSVRVVVAAALPGGTIDGAIPAPFKGMSVNGPTGPIVGGSLWNTSLRLQSFTSQIDAIGPVFVKTTLQYVFVDGGSLTMSFTLAGGDTFATVDESYKAGSHASNDAWMLDLGSGLQPNKALIVSTHTCDLNDPFSQPVSNDVTKVVYTSLRPNKRLGNSLGYLFHRWNQVLCSFLYSFFAFLIFLRLIHTLLPRAVTQRLPSDRVIRLVPGWLSLLFVEVYGGGQPALGFHLAN